MNKKLLSLFVVAVFLVATLGTVSAQLNKDLNDEHHVTLGLAKRVALFHIKNCSRTGILEAWKDATVGKPKVYYKPYSEARSAYVFPVIKKNKNVGYVTVSATFDKAPILEFSRAPPPSSNIKEIRAKARKEGYRGTERLVYYGALTYSLQYGRGKAIGLVDGRTHGVPKEIDLQISERKARTAWNKAMKAMNKGVRSGMRGFVYKKISGVEAWWGMLDGHDPSASYPDCADPGYKPDPWDAYDGCAPMAAGMVVDYWYDKYGWYYPSKNALIDHLHHYMGTDDDGSTDKHRIGPGIRGATSHLGHRIYAYDTWFFDWNDIKSEIDNGQPFVLAMIDPPYPYKANHAVTGVGYYMDFYSGTNYVVVHDG
ncbi:MAG: C39 family peptidase, partial [Euryarchaeota archaeon]|nr:C39 family peptidase [Euryarchaeota archaeon]